MNSDFLAKGVLYLALSVLATSVQAANYYVSPTGSDTDPGTLAAPWRTLAKANKTSRAGDTVYLRAGNYPEMLSPTNSGTAAQPITYKAYGREFVNIEGSDSAKAAAEWSTSFISLENLSIRKARHAPGYNNNVVIRGNGNLLKNCRVVSPQSAVAVHDEGVFERGINLMGSYNRIENSEVANMTVGVALSGGHHNVVSGNRIHDSYLDAIRVGAQRGSTLIEDNRLWGSKVSDGIQFNPSSDLPEAIQQRDTSNCRVVIRRNVIFDNAENGIDLKGACSIVVEENVVYGSRGDNDGVERFNPAAQSVNDRAGGRAIMHGSNRKSRDVIIRRNVVYDNSGGILLNDEGWVVYHNTIVGNNRDFTGANSRYVNPGKPLFVGVEGYGPGNNAIKNNIIGDHADVEASLPPGSRIDLDGNLYFYRHSVPFFATSRQPWSGVDFSEWRQTIGSYGNLVGREASSGVVGDPRFVNVPPRPTMSMGGLDFRLRADSAAIDKGLALTSAVGTGSGTTIRVRQPRYFSDGFDIADGDAVRVGGDQTARVLEVNNATGVLVLDRSIAWRDGDAVTVDYEDRAPDIGAFEFGGATR